MDPKSGAIHVETIVPPAGQSFRLLRWRDNLRDVEQFTAEGRAVPFEGAGDHWHLHREMELTYIERGSGQRLVGDHIAQLHGPEIQLLAPNLPHCARGLRRSRGLSVQFHWPADYPLRSLPEFAAIAPLWDRSIRGLLIRGPLLRRISPKLLTMPSRPPAERLGLLLQILTEIAAAPASRVVVLSRLAFSVQEGGRHQTGIERVIRRVMDIGEAPLAFAEILRLAGMSKASFARHFPRYTGFTFTEFLNRVRLDHARRLVLATDDPIGEIAYASGFNHLSYFNRLYLRRYGRTPSSDRARASPMR